jgi:hypothetical protein
MLVVHHTELSKVWCTKGFAPLDAARAGAARRAPPGGAARQPYLKVPTAFECRRHPFVVLTVMQTSPPSSPTPLIQKLIFVTLLLNLLCLVVLLGWTFVRDLKSEPAREVDVTATDSTVNVAAESEARREEPVRSVAPRATNPSRYSPTNRVAFQPARIPAAADQPPPSTDTPETTVIPPLPARIIDARTAVMVEEGAGAGAPVSVSGRVTLRGTPPREIPIDLGPTCGPVARGPVTTRHYVVNPEGYLANVFVFMNKTGVADSDSFIPGADDQAISEVLDGYVPARGGSVLVNQKGCMFEPYVTAMQIGQTLRVRNSDATLHNVHLTPRRNREINIGQPLKQVNNIAISTPESFIRLKCDVHPWMFAYVSVVAHQFFAVTSTNGTYRIPAGLPDGDYVVTAAHLKLGRKSAGVRIHNGSASPVDFEFSIPDPANRQAVGRPRF